MNRIITQEYLDFCRTLQKRKLNEVKGLTHKHHIYPKSLYPGLKNSKYNIVILTIYEHILAHKMLAESGNCLMVRTYNLMSNHKLSLKGTWNSEETKNKQREAAKNRIRNPFTEEHKRKLSEAKIGNKNCLGTKFSEEYKFKMSKIKKGIPWSQARRDAYNKRWGEVA
jgi:hypothetical protein